jgi:8-oxo-dGTP diphosphatase
MRGFYKNEDRFYVAVDCIIFGFDKEGLKVLLIKRNYEPGRDQRSLMGGFLKEDESLDDAAKRILYELTGLKDIYLEQLYAYGDPARDPGARVLSVAYFAIIKAEFLESRNDDYDAKWYRIDSIPEVVFDHGTMIEKGIKRLRRRAASEPIGFELLPEKFTIPQLRNLYEAIYQQQFDKRNFSKKIFAMDVLERLNKKDKTGSKKGAFLYRFDVEKYNALKESGMSFRL